MNTIVKIDPTEFGLEETKAQDIASQFKPMLDKMIELENEFNEVIKLDIQNPNTSKIAKELRLKYVKVRTGTAEIHKQQKAFFLAGGRFVDGWKNAQIFASQGIEKKLEEIERYFEIQEQKRIEELNSKRILLVSEYEIDGSTLNLGNMPDDVFALYLDGLKIQFENKQQAERLAKEEADRKSKLHDERRALVTPFMQFVPKELLWVNYSEMQEEEFNSLLNDLILKKEVYDSEIEKQKIEAERLKLETEELNRKLDAERKEREQKEAELKAQKEAEDQRLRQEQFEAEKKRKEAEKLAKASTQEQLLNWLETFGCDDMPEKLQQNDLANEILSTFWKFKSWAKKEIEKI
jgi:hypothetical protein